MMTNRPSGWISMPAPCAYQSPASSAKVRGPGEDDLAAALVGGTGAWLAELAQLEQATARMTARAAARTARLSMMAARQTRRRRGPWRPPAGRELRPGHAATGPRRHNEPRNDSIIRRTAKQGHWPWRSSASTAWAHVPVRTNSKRDAHKSGDLPGIAFQQAGQGISHRHRYE